jgi:hypothetical protein
VFFQFLVINWRYKFKPFFVSSSVVVKPENMPLIEEPAVHHHETVPSNLTLHQIES